jgi:hypothetical protein
MAREYDRGDLVRYTGSRTSLHGVYTVIRMCPCCEDGIRWRIAAVDVLLTCVRPESIAPVRAPKRCEECGERRPAPGGPWCGRCLEAWAAANT